MGCGRGGGPRPHQRQHCARPGWPAGACWQAPLLTNKGLGLTRADVQRLSHVPGLVVRAVCRARLQRHQQHLGVGLRHGRQRIWQEARRAGQVGKGSLVGAPAGRLLTISRPPAAHRWSNQPRYSRLRRRWYEACRVADARALPSCFATRAHLLPAHDSAPRCSPQAGGTSSSWPYKNCTHRALAAAVGGHARRRKEREAASGWPAAPPQKLGPTH